MPLIVDGLTIAETQAQISQIESDLNLKDEYNQIIQARREQLNNSPPYDMDGQKYMTLLRLYGTRDILLGHPMSDASSIFSSDDNSSLKSDSDYSDSEVSVHESVHESDNQQEVMHIYSSDSDKRLNEDSSDSDNGKRKKCSDSDSDSDCTKRKRKHKPGEPCPVSYSDYASGSDSDSDSD